MTAMGSAYLFDKDSEALDRVARVLTALSSAIGPRLAEALRALFPAVSRP